MDISLRDNPRYNWWLLLGLLITVYLAITLALPYVKNATVATYLLRPIMWGLVAAVVLVLLPKYRAASKSRHKNSFIQLGLMIGVFQVAIMVIGGLFFGFGRSPNSFTPLAVISSLFLVVLTLIGMEISRAWLVNRLGKHHIFFALALVTMIYTMFSVPLTTLINPREPLEMVNYLNSRIFPLLAENLLASFLALLAGPLAAIAYRGTLQAFWWFSPVLPDLTWVLQGLIGTMVPILGFVVVQSFYSSKTERGPKGRAKEGRFPVGWIVTTIAAVTIIWFSVGLFPFHPTLVASGSMRPTIDVGDVLIIAKASADVVEEGDIIQFRQGDNTIMHRVIEIQEVEGAKFFITQGDANNAPDLEAVGPEQVVGKAVFTVPKIGWVAIVIKNFFSGE